MIDILVPVLGRPWNVEPFLKSTKVTAHEYRVIFICSPEDDEQIQACLNSGEATWTVDWEPERADFAKKINYGFEHSDSEWVFQAADDIRFRPAWDVQALRRGRKFSVIGTNDLHNHAVRGGVHSTHTLFKRSYIEDYGGTFDGSGTVFSEEYDHQFVDNEFIETAKYRGQWVFARRSHVEHFHPVWGNSQWDDTYRKAFRATEEDKELFVKRMRLLQRAVSR